MMRFIRRVYKVSSFRDCYIYSCSWCIVMVVDEETRSFFTMLLYHYSANYLV